MKCHSCGAIGSPGKANCEFCGAAFVLMQAGREAPRAPQAPQAAPRAAVSPEETVVDVGNSAPTGNTFATPQISFVKDTLNLIGELHATTKSGFNIWAFFFPVAYLFGYGASDNAKKVAATCLIPQFILAILAYISWRLTNALDVVAAIWFLYVCYLVSTRTHALVVKGVPYNMTTGILAEIVFIFVYYIIALLQATVGIKKTALAVFFIPTVNLIMSLSQ